MVADGFLQKTLVEPEFYGVMAVLGFMTFNLQLALAAILFGLHMAKNQLGSSAAAMARSLKNF